MSKEELRMEFENKLTNTIGQNISAGILPLSNMVVDAAIDISERYAKRQAIEFGKWVSSHRLDFQTTANGKWIGLDLETVTTEELYNQFLQPKSIKP